MAQGTTSILKTTFGEALDEQTLATLRTMAKRSSYPAGTVLCQQGRVESTFYIIIDGRVLVTQKSEGGEDRILAHQGPNECFGELGLLDDQPRHSTAMTTKPTSVFEVTKEVFGQIVEKSPAVAYTITKHVMDTLRVTSQNALEDMRAKNAELEKAYADLKRAQAALVEKEKLERELELAAAMQSSLLPKRLAEFPDCAFAAYQKAARHVGGDLYNVIPLEKDHVGFVIGDVSDKGMQAAFFMAIAQTLFCREGRRSLSPAAVAQSVHAGLLDVAPGSEVFVTIFYGVLHRPSRKLTYVRAGHEPPMLVRPGQPVQLLEGQGRFLGMMEELRLEEQSCKLRPGDKLVLYSDGVTEATDKAGKMFGKEQLVALLESSTSLSAAELQRKIVAALERWTGVGAVPFDDLTLMVMEVC